MSFPALQEIILKKESTSPIQDKSGSPDQKIKMQFRGKIKTLNTFNSLKKSQPSPEKKKLFERLSSHDLSQLPKSMPQLDNAEIEKQNKSAISNQEPEPQISLRYSVASNSIIDDQKLIKSSLLESNPEVMKALAQIKKAAGEGEEAQMSSSVDKLKEEQLLKGLETARQTEIPEGTEIPEKIEILEKAEVLEKQATPEKSEALNKTITEEAPGSKETVSGVLATVLENVAINYFARMVEEAFNSIKREYIRKVKIC